jgi:hypothetical protein
VALPCPETDQFTCHDTTIPWQVAAGLLSLTSLSLLPPSMSRRPATMLPPPPPPVDRDVIMGPPPVPPHQPFTPSSVQNSKDPREFSEKYYKLKRKYWELEEVRFSRILPVLSPSFLIVLFITNRNIKTSRMSSDAQASEILVGILKRGMRFFVPSIRYHLPHFLFLVCSLTEFSNWKPPWHASLPAHPLTVQTFTHILKLLPHFLAPSSLLMPSLHSILIYTKPWMKSGVKILR